MKLRNYQRQAVKKLKQRIEYDWEDDLPSTQVLKADTGAGKTVILGYTIDEFIEEWDENLVALWVSPGKGDLLNQSYQSVNSMIGQSRRVYLYDTSITSMLPSDIMFVNWEKLNKKNNTAMKDGEKTNFKDLINNVRMMGCKIILAVDESHKNFNADKSDKIVKMINPDCVVKASATPNDKPTVVVPFADVVSAGMVKRKAIINKDMGVKESDEFKWVFDSAEKCFGVIQDKYVPYGIKPLMLVNVENAKGGEDGLEIKLAEEYQAGMGRTVENGKLAVWTSKRKDNLNNLSDFGSDVEVLIFKMAITEGWDCPRACVLVELRQGMAEAFKLQVVGRILRMPERKHYGDEWLDNAYIFTNDRDFTIEQDDDGPMCRETEEVALKSGVSLKLDGETIKRDWSDIQVEDGVFEELFFEVGDLEE